jgi:hypothetical protein
MVKLKHKTKWSSASPIVECHCVHVCTFAHEELNNMQMPALSSRMQCSEALSAKKMGQKGTKTFSPKLK